MVEWTNIYWTLCIWLVLLAVGHSDMNQTGVKGREKERNFLPGCSLIKFACYNMQLKATLKQDNPSNLSQIANPSVTDDPGIIYLLKLGVE